MANPQNLLWTGTTQYEDGSPYTEANHGGYEVEVNGQAAFSVPIGWHVDNLYSFPIRDIPGKRQGTNIIRMQTVSSNGTPSGWTAPVSFEYELSPQMPTNIGVE